jgi:Domain of unknown function (DUF4288)
VTDSPAKWFSALLVLEATHPDEPPGRPLFEQRIVLVRAATEEDARTKAAARGRAAEHTYVNPYGNRVAWVFREVLHVVELLDDTIADGTEVYHAFLSLDELEQLRRSLEPREDFP